MRLHYIRSGQLHHLAEYHLLLTGQSPTDTWVKREAISSLRPFSESVSINIKLDSAWAGFPLASRGPYPLRLLTPNDQSDTRGK